VKFDNFCELKIVTRAVGLWPLPLPQQQQSNDIYSNV